MATVSFLNSTDPSDADTIDGFFYSLDFDNDGTLDLENATSAVIDIPLQYRNDAGTYTIRGLIKDLDGGSTELFTQLVVNEVAPVLNLTGAGSANEGELYQLDFSAGDPGNDTISQWLIDWNDGTVESFAGAVSTAAHRFADDGLRTVKVTAIDEDGTYTANQAVNVANVAPQLSEVAATESDEGGFTRLTGAIADAGVLDSFILDIDWGDGTLQSVAFAAGAARFDVTHSYLDDNPSGTEADDYVISLALRDDEGGTDTATANVRVGNVAPELEGLSVSSPLASENEEITLTASIVDAGILDGHQVMIDWGDGHSSAAVVDTVAQLFTARHVYTDDNPTLTPLDSYTITATVTDDDGGQSQSATVVTVVNADPVITGLDLGQTQLNASTFQASLQGIYIDKGLLDTHTVSVDWGDGAITQATVDALSRTFQAQHDYQSATLPNYAITATLTDDDGGLTAAGVGGPVNRVPVARDDSFGTFQEQPVELNILDNDSDPDNDPLKAFVLSAPSHGVLKSLGNGLFNYKPSTNFSGTDSFTYRLSDGQTGSNIATVSIDVTAVNFKPEVEDDAYSVAEDSTLNVAALGVLENDSDVDGDVLSALLVTGPQHGQLTLNNNGSFSYTPDLNFNGADSFSYRASDGVLESELATVSLTITAVNDAPLARNDSYSLDEDSTLNVAALGVLANDSDSDGDVLSALLVTGPTHGQLTLNANGSFDYTPDLNFFGEDSFSYRASDGSLESGVANVNLTITAVNDAPLARNDSYSLDEDSTQNVPALGVLANDSDSDGDVLSALLVTGPTHGQLTLNNNGSFSYTPDLNFNGADSFSYRASDDSLQSGVATVNLTITAVNDAPLARNDTYSLDEDTTLNIASAQGVLANDSDNDGDVLSALLVTGPTHGQLTLNTNGSFSYTPDLNFFGADSFSYRASDGSLESAIATVNLTITAVNDAPLAQNDSYSLAEDSTLNISAPGVLVNDSDVDGDVLSAVLVTAPQHGQLILNTNGSFSYTPNLNFFGEDSFSYRAHDGLTGSNEATVNLTVTEVTPVNVAPVFVSTPGTAPLTASAPVGGVQDRVFQVAGNPGANTAVTFNLGALDTSKYDIGLYRVDDMNGRIGTLQPGETGYSDAALASGRALTLFNANSKAGGTAQLNLAAGDLYGFYLIVNPARINTLGSSPAQSASYGSNVFFSLEGANPEGYDQLRGSVVNGTLQLGWDSAVLAGDNDYRHVQLSAQGFELGGQADFSYAALAVDANNDAITYSLIQGPSGAQLDAQTGLLTFRASIGSYDFIIGAGDGQHAPAQQAVHLDVVAPAAANTMTAFAATANGFRVRLAQAIDPARLDLGNTANVQLTGSSRGAINGTLLIDDDRAGFTFFKTGGALLDDQYTVTLRSAADAFIQAGNTSAGFTVAGVAAATRIGISDVVGVPGQTVNGGLTVSLTNTATTVTTVRFALRYDPALLTLTGATLATGLPAGTRLSSDLTTPGYARFSIASRTALPTGTLALLNLSATVPVNAPTGAQQVLKVVDRFVNGVPSVLNSDGLQRVVSSAQPLLAAAPVTTTGAFADILNAADLPAIVAQAKQQWLNSGRIDTTRLALLDHINVNIADLGGLLLGQETGDMILIDRDAAGHGWFVDRTPGQNEEYLGNPDGSLLANPHSDAGGRMDLLTVISHEMGHILGFTHTEETGGTVGLMDATLAAGIRELPGLEGVSYYDTDAGLFVKADPQGPAKAASAQDDFIVDMTPTKDQPRNALYEIKRADAERDPALSPVIPTDESESLVSRFKKMVSGINRKK